MDLRLFNGIRSAIMRRVRELRGLSLKGIFQTVFTRLLSILSAAVLFGCVAPTSPDKGDRRAPFVSVNRLPETSRADVAVLEETLLECLAHAGFSDLAALSGDEVVRRSGCVVDNFRTKNCRPSWYNETQRHIRLYPSTVTDLEKESPLYHLLATPRSQYYSNGYNFYDWSDPTQPLPRAARSIILNLVNGKPAC